MKTNTLRVMGLAAGVIALAGIAAWMGLAHGCEAPQSVRVIAGHITIDPTLADRVRPTDVLFIIVRRPQGPPRPIAVKRVDSPRFPVSFKITSDDVMLKGSKLQGMVEILARLDRDGLAGPPEPGDLEGVYDRNPTMVGKQNLEIVISKVY